MRASKVARSCRSDRGGDHLPGRAASVGGPSAPTRPTGRGEVLTAGVVALSGSEGKSEIRTARPPPPSRLRDLGWVGAVSSSGPGPLLGGSGPARSTVHRSGPGVGSTRARFHVRPTDALVDWTGDPYGPGSGPGRGCRPGRGRRPAAASGPAVRGAAGAGRLGRRLRDLRRAVTAAQAAGADPALAEPGRPQRVVRAGPAVAGPGVPAGERGPRGGAGAARAAPAGPGRDRARCPRHRPGAAPVRPDPGRPAGG